MKTFLIISVLFCSAMMLMPLGLSARSHAHHAQCNIGDTNMFRAEDVDLDLDNGSIIFKHDDDGTVEITKAHALFVNGRELHLRRDQRVLVRDYYDAFEAVVEDAKTIAVAGVKLGAKGVAMGLVAACRALGGDVDEDEHHVSVDHDSEELKAEEAKLEERAERLKRKAEHLEKLHGELRAHVSELEQLGWF